MRILLVGDSHSQALWPRVKPWLEGRGHEVLAISHPGWSEQRYLDDPELWAALKQFRPDGVVVELGGNNRARGTTYDAILSTFTSRLQAAGVNVIWWVGPSTATKEPFRGAHEATAALQNITIPSLKNARWMDSRPYTRSYHRDDGVHFQKEGYDRWAAEIKAFLVRPVVLQQE